jgi:hypothetical protein
MKPDKVLKVEELPPGTNGRHAGGNHGKAKAQSAQTGTGTEEGSPAARSERKSVSTCLVELVISSGTELWHTPDQTSYASVPKEDHREHWAIRSTSFRRWLCRSYFLAEQKSPASQALQDALGVLDGKALFEGPEHSVHVRLAAHQDRIYLDLGDPHWRVVEIDAKGWRLLTTSPVRFRRPKGLLALPVPQSGGSLDLLRPFVNVASDDQWRLLVAWIVAAFRPRGPYPLLVLCGEAGTAKTTLGKLLRSLIDPSVTSLRSEPRELRDLMIAATNGYVAAFDNLSYLPSWLSDALCRLATGGGFATRELYTNDEEVLFEAIRPTIITAINEVVTAGDLLDRAIFLTLRPISEETRSTEEDLMQRFEATRPRILGALLGAVAAGLRQLPQTRLERLPRMADFARWAEAVSRGIGWQPHAFLNSYRGAIESANSVALEASPIASPLFQFMAARSQWTGTASELLPALVSLAGEAIARSRDWPKKPNALSNALRRLGPNLRRLGLDVTFDREGKGRARTIILRRRPEEKSRETSSASSASSATPQNHPPGSEPNPKQDNDFDEEHSRATAADDGGRWRTMADDAADDGGRWPAQEASGTNPKEDNGFEKEADEADDADDLSRDHSCDEVDAGDDLGDPPSWDGVLKPNQGPYGERF